MNTKVVAQMKFMLRFLVFTKNILVFNPMSAIRLFCDALLQLVLADIITV